MAKPGAHCVRPDGRPLGDDKGPREHAQRLDLACAAFNGLSTRGWAQDACFSDFAARCVLREIRASLGYKQLVKSGVIREDQWQDGEHG
jgi:hypothetical protein